jgi:hypothetical protein
MSARRVGSSSRGGTDLRSHGLLAGSLAASWYHNDPPFERIGNGRGQQLSFRLTLVSSSPLTVMFRIDETFRRPFMNVATAANFPVDIDKFRV